MTTSAVYNEEEGLAAFHEREQTAARVAPTIDDLRSRARSQLAEVLDLAGTGRDR